MNTKKLTPLERAKLVAGAVVANSEKVKEHVGENQPKTGPGLMANAMVQNFEAVRELGELKAKWDGANPTLKLNPWTIRRSKFANRDERSFKSANFDTLRADIKTNGGNVQPIKVRPVIHTDPQQYEIVFGHRRHQACLELGIDVLAFVEDADDQSLFEQMDRENRQRADLRPYEQGVMYARALDDGLYPSMRKMAEALGVDVGGVSRYVALARLPSDVLMAFSSPLEFQYNWVSKLAQTLQDNPDLVLARAKVLCRTTPRLPSLEVFKKLTELDSVVPHNTTLKASVMLTGKSGQAGEIAFNSKRKTFEISLSGVDQGRIEEIKKSIQNLIS